MHDFTFKKKQLYCESVPVKKIADEVGTPVYIYSRETIIYHYLKMKNAFAELKPLICFSVKSNSNLAICRLDRKSTRLNSSHIPLSRMPSSA